MPDRSGERYLDIRAWLDAIHAAREKPRRIVTAQTYAGEWWPDCSSKPVLLTCDDGRDYVVKSAHAGRIPVNDHVIGHLALAMNAPVPPVRLVHVPAVMIAEQAEMRHMTPGLAHGSEAIAGVYESYMVEHARVRRNRSRFARLAVLWGVVGVFDQQFLYQEESPPILFAADHGHAFPRGPHWTRGDLLRYRGVAEPDAYIMRACRFTTAELRAAGDALAGIDDARIADAVAAPPDGWGFSAPDRAALARYVARQRDAMLRHLQQIT
jgi:hypothetical protein